MYTCIMTTLTGISVKSSLSTTLSLEDPKNFSFDTKHEESEKQEGQERKIKA